MEYLFTKHHDGSEANGTGEALLMVNSEKEAVLLYGHGDDELGGFRWQREYDHEPTESEVRTDIEALVNALTEERIRTGLVVEGHHLWLSEENQLNIQSAMAPVRMKLGEDEEGKPVYHTFETEEELTAFRQMVSRHIMSCLNAGWEEKDNIQLTIKR